MGKPTGFLEYTRELPKNKVPEERVKEYKEFSEKPSEELVNSQSARCMDCGVPFCHNGCPLGNIIPEFNDAVYNENWEEASSILHSTNNFPEFTGRICPAPCESACVLGINQPPVAIEFIEKTIVEKAYELGFIQPRKVENKTGKTVAVVGSGPAGLAVADQLNKAGHDVTVFERAEEAGGLLRYGIPDFKLGKQVVARRVDVMAKSGVTFKTSTEIGKDIPTQQLKDEYDAVVLTGGSTTPRNVPITGRDLNGVHFAMDFLSQQNGRVSGKTETRNHKGHKIEEIWATDKNVVVIGGGDTGSDCVGTSNRHGAKSITQIELLERPPLERSETTPWPLWPNKLRTSTSHEEGANRQWALFTQEFIGDDEGNLKAIKVCDMGWSDPQPGKKPHWEPIEGSEREIPCELALLAIGFLHPDKEGMITELGLDLDERGNIKCDAQYRTSEEKVFAAGDMRRGQSLVVWAISEGRECARNVDEFLMGESVLEAKDSSFLATH
ncbi:MAG: glutamate synthase subunit beta [Cyclobacteriaceae bacterium]